MLLAWNDTLAVDDVDGERGVDWSKKLLASDRSDLISALFPLTVQLASDEP